MQVQKGGREDGEMAHLEEKKGKLGEGGKGLGEKDLEGLKERLQKRSSPSLWSLDPLCPPVSEPEFPLPDRELLPLAVSTGLRGPRGVASGRRRSFVK